MLSLWFFGIHWGNKWFTIIPCTDETRGNNTECWVNNVQNCSWSNRSVRAILLVRLIYFVKSNENGCILRTDMLLFIAANQSAWESRGMNLKVISSDTGCQILYCRLIALLSPLNLGRLTSMRHVIILNIHAKQKKFNAYLTFSNYTVHTDQMWHQDVPDWSFWTVWWYGP
jgi:hypothetical protein